MKNLTDPDWWLSSLTLLLIGLLLPVAFRKVQSSLRQYARHNKIRNLKRVRELRWDSLQIIQLINRATANYVICVVLIVAYLHLIIFFAPLRTALKSIPLTILLASPIYFFQIRWLISNSLAKEAIKPRRKVRGLRKIT